MYRSWVGSMVKSCMHPPQSRSVRNNRKLSANMVDRPLLLAPGGGYAAASTAVEAEDPFVVRASDIGSMRRPVRPWPAAGQ